MVSPAQRPLYSVFVLTSEVTVVFQLFEVISYWTFGQVKFYCSQIYINLIRIYLSTFFNNASQAIGVANAD